MEYEYSGGIIQKDITTVVGKVTYFPQKPAFD